jgi:hypothetical protein
MTSMLDLPSRRDSVLETVDELEIEVYSACLTCTMLPSGPNPSMTTWPRSATHIISTEIAASGPKGVPG